MTDPLDLHERINLLTDTTITFEGTFEPLRRDLTVTPKPEDRKPCPRCHELADEIRYEGAIVNVTPGETGVRVHVPSVKAAVFVPCGHRFDGATGELIGDDDD